VPADVEMLADVPFFALLDDRERTLLAERLDVVKVPAGETLFSYGDPGDALYVVRSGEVEMFFKNDTGDRIILETARAGDFFGETSLMDGGPRTASGPSADLSLLHQRRRRRGAGCTHARATRRQCDTTTT